MEAIDHFSMFIQSENQIAEARRHAESMLRENNFNAEKMNKAALAITEIASNLVKHTECGGTLSVNILEADSNLGVEILAFDHGNGMSDVSKCLADGFSTTKTLGAGLGAIKRVTTNFAIYSAPKLGTLLLCELWHPSFLRQKNDDYLIGAVALPSLGQVVCGDAWSTSEKPQRTVMLLADGLGHGDAAAIAARKAVAVFKASTELKPVQILQAIHEHLQDTRGAVVAIACLDPVQKNIHYVSVGNITATLITATSKNKLFTHNGIVGLNMPTITESIYPLAERDYLIMHSDGLDSNWSLDQYPNLPCDNPTVIAGLLCRDFRKQSDDVTVIVAIPPAKDWNARCV